MNDLAEREKRAVLARNPFRATDRREQFIAVLADYVAARPVLFRSDGRENRSNNIGEAFWRGHDGERFIWDRNTPIYVAFKAGAAVANKLQELAGKRRICKRHR